MDISTSAREGQAYETAMTLLATSDRGTAEAALARLPLTSGDATLLRMALGMERRDTRAMMLGKATVRLVELDDAAAGVGIARALLDFWTGDGMRDPRYAPLARVEIGSALVMQSGGLVRLGKVDRAVALVGAFPGLHDKRRYLAIRAAEGLARAERYDEARELMPAECPSGDIGEDSNWRVAANLLRATEPDDGDADNGGSSELSTKWNKAIDELITALRSIGARSGFPVAITDMMIQRIEAERAKGPRDASELVDRLSRLREAMTKGLTPR